MSKNTAQLLGAIAAVLVMAFVTWQRIRPPPCPGGVFVELHPPLSEPGPYRFRLHLDDAEKPCEFEVALPVSARVDTSACKMAVALKTAKRGSHETVLGLTFAAHPERVKFEVLRQAEKIYDLTLTPQYSPYEVRREDDKRFCGEQARLQPQCLRESSECSPFPVVCDGPEDCGEHKVCCVSPEWGRDFGKLAASECSGRNACLDRLAHIACHEDGDCPRDMSCDDTSLGSEFKPALRACRQREAR